MCKFTKKIGNRLFFASIILLKSEKKQNYLLLRFLFVRNVVSL